MNPKEAELLIRLDEKMDSVRDDISDLKTTTALQQENLAEHMRRSELLEEQMDLMNKEVRPILEGVSFLKKVAKFAVGLATIVKAISLFWK